MALNNTDISYIIKRINLHISVALEKDVNSRFYIKNLSVADCRNIMAEQPKILGEYKLVSIENQDEQLTFLNDNISTENIIFLYPVNSCRIGYINDAVLKTSKEIILSDSLLCRSNNAKRIGATAGYIRDKYRK